MLFLEPVIRLSSATTLWPWFRSVSQRCEPMNPAAPEITYRNRIRPPSNLSVLHSTSYAESDFAGDQPLPPARHRFRSSLLPPDLAGRHNDSQIPPGPRIRPGFPPPPH